MATDKPPFESPSASTDKKLSPGPIVFVIGPPASGKGTLCSRLCKQIPDSFRHLSVGDYLREFCSSFDPEALSERIGQLPNKEIVKYVQESRLLPPGTIIPLIKQKMLEGQSSPSTGWLIDGFPRDIQTALAFEKEIKAPSRVILLHCSAPLARERFVERRRTSTDDNGFFDKRLKEYDEKLPVILNRYRDIIINVQTNGTRDESWGNLVQAVGTLPEFQGLRMFE